jgi:hypothetical protein
MTTKDHMGLSMPLSFKGIARVPDPTDTTYTVTYQSHPYTVGVPEPMPKKNTRVAGQRTAKQMLKLIDRFLEHRDAESDRLWWVLTALRGPDSDNWNEKMQTTAHVRAKAFPRTAKGSKLVNWGPGGAVFFHDQPFNTDELSSVHFRAHITRAALVLGLKNEPTAQGPSR